jgi:uncharacterized protein YdeI (YjbR/CyaY-like superfamily)
MNTIPNDLAEALESAGLSEFFSGCTNSHRNEYLKWIAEAKRPEARKDRIGKAMKMLAAKRAEESVLAKKKKT